MPSIFLKDPDSTLDYKFDWAALANGSGSTNWLDTDETISTRTVTVDTGITKKSDAITDEDTSVTVWLSGGTDKVDYEVACKIETSASRIDERTMKIQVRER